MAGEIRTGTSSWTSEAWWRKIYPDRTPPAERLSIYSRIYDCVEVDATYYAPPVGRMVEGWYGRTPPGFLFTLKVTRDLLDPKKPLDPEKLAAFVRTAQRLREKLGPLLLQFPPWVKPGHSAGFLWKLLSALPSGPRYGIELRDAGWYSGETGSRLLRELTDRGMILVWSSLTYVDVPAERTSDEVYLRFIGDHTSIPADTHGEVRADRSAETRKWADRLRSTADDLKRALVFFNNHYAGFAPESVNLFRQMMGLPTIDYRRFAPDEGPAAGERTPEVASLHPVPRRLEEFE